MNIVLIGMRGSGKTTVGKILAKNLGKEFIETDKLISQNANLTILEIVTRFGWEKFRDLEEEVVKKCALLNNVIISAGGGIVVRNNSVRALKEKGKLIWLKADTNTLLKRIGNDPNRPSLTGKSIREDIITICKERKRLYRQAADFIIDSVNKSPQKIVGEILKMLQWETYD